MMEKKKADPHTNSRYITVSYKGREYSSLRQFCREHGLKYSRIYMLQKQGYTIERIIEQEGIIIDFPEDHKQNAIKNGLYVISAMPIGIRKVFEDNPYCVLGLPCNATRVDALERRDKFEKLNRLGAVSTFKSVYDLERIERPDRDLGHIQVVLNNIEKMEYRWIWFLKTNYTDSWDNEDILKSCDPNKFEYDEFLACYYNALILDPSFSDVNRWKKLFRMIDWFFNTADKDVYKVLAERISNLERTKYNYRMVVNSFRENIKNPLMASIDNADGNGLLAVIAVIEECQGIIVNEISDRISSLVMRWVEHSLEELEAILKMIKSTKSLNDADSSEANTIYRCLDNLARNEFPTAKRISEKIDGFHSEMIMDRFKSQFYIATIALIANGRKKDACRFDSMIYIYCTDKQKNAIKHTYPMEWLDIPDSEFSVEECRKIAGRFETLKDWKNGFKWMMKAALKGDAASQNDIGVYYAMGKGRPVDGSEAVRWYKKAANGGSAVAWGNLAVRYYYGWTPFAKSLDKAKECYIKAYIIDRFGGHDKKLDEFFPNWRHEAHPLLKFSEKDKYRRISAFAEAGITDAEYWYGVWLYKGENGCIQNKSAARRWFLKAAVYNHPLAISDLKAYYDIDAQETSIAKEMFDLGYSYSKKGGRQNQDLCYFWYYKAVINGYKSGYNNLGVCYYDGVGVEKNYEKANEYYLKAIEYENNVGALFNYATNLYWGEGVRKNRKKAKKFLLIARSLGSKSAVRALEEYFGLTGIFEFEDFIAQTIYDNGGLKIEFCGIKDGNGKIQFKFLVDNTSTTQYNIWLRNVLLNGNEIEAFKKIGNYKANTGHQYETIELKGELSENNSSIEFEIEVDDSADHELFTTKKVKLDTLVAEKTLRFSLIDGTESKAQSNWDPKDYDFANEEFEDIVIYDNGGFRVEFGGLVVEDEEEVYIKIWSRNTSKEKYKIWLKDVVVDGERVSKYEEGAVCIPDGSWNYSRILTESVNAYDCYDIEFTAEINDENNNAVAMSKRVTVYVDFPNEEINVSLSEHADFEEN